MEFVTSPAGWNEITPRTEQPGQRGGKEEGRISPGDDRNSSLPKKIALGGGNGK